MATILPFRKSNTMFPSGPWTAEERAALLDLLQKMFGGRAGSLELRSGVAENGRAWCAIVDRLTGEQLLSVTRAADRYFLHSRDDDAAIEGTSLRNLDQRLAERRYGSIAEVAWLAVAGVHLGPFCEGAATQAAVGPTPDIAMQFEITTGSDISAFFQLAGVLNHSVAASSAIVETSRTADGTSARIASKDASILAPRFEAEHHAVGTPTFVDREQSAGSVDPATASSATTHLALAADGRQASAPGSAGDDALVGGQGNDTLEGSEGNDTLDGGGGSDSLSGGSGDDVLVGSSGDDVLDGGEGDDVLQGGGGADTLDGGEGFDDVAGGDGDDWIVLRSGTQASGGSGSDRFEVSFRAAVDNAPALVRDFERHVDRIIYEDREVRLERELPHWNDDKRGEILLDLDGDGRTDLIVRMLSVAHLPDQYKELDGSDADFIRVSVNFDAMTTDLAVDLVDILDNLLQKKVLLADLPPSGGYQEAHELPASAPIDTWI